MEIELGNLAGHNGQWKQFLKTVAYQYKYSFSEQLLIFAQRPEATACADYWTWNTKIRRSIRSGAKGIGLLYIQDGKTGVRYVFDVADTVERANSREFSLWQLESRHMGAVMKNLGDYSDSPELFSRIVDAAEHMAAEYWEAHKDNVLEQIENTLVAEYDETVLRGLFCNVTALSIQYTVMTRCNLEPDRYFSEKDFPVYEWNSNVAIEAVGEAVSYCTNSLLRQIERVVKSIDREAERSSQNVNGRNQEQHQIRSEGGLSRSGHGGAGESDRAVGQIRPDEAEVSQGTQADHIQPSASQGGADPAPVRGGRGGEQPAAPADARTGERGGSDGAAEGRGHDEMGRIDERLQGAGGGDYLRGADLRLTESKSNREEAEDNGSSASSFSDVSFMYSLLDRLRTDCEYFLSWGNRSENHLWAKSVSEQIAEMRKLYEALPEKPEWLSEEDIDSYEERMSPRYQVVVYHHFENGFDEKREYQTLSEAERAAQSYVDGTMESDGFQYDGAAVYDLQEKKYLRIIGSYPDQAAQEQVQSLESSADAQPDTESQLSLFTPQTEKAYDLGYGHLGNGLTVWNRLEEEHGDYRTVAHISTDRSVKIYDDDMPQAVRDEIQHIADTAEMMVSTTQNIPVFTVPPKQEKPTEGKEEPDSPLVSPAAPTQKRSGRTFPERNYKAFQKLFPEFVSGEYSYLRLQAGESFMPLCLEWIGENEISVTHYYAQNGDLMCDPEMTFRIDGEAGTLEPLTFQQDNLGIYQEVYPEEGMWIPALRRDLNNFANSWFKNISQQGYIKERGTLAKDGQEIQFDETGNPIEQEPAPRMIQLPTVNHLGEDEMTSRPVTRQGDVITIGDSSPSRTIDITVSDETWEQIQEAIPEQTDHDTEVSSTTIYPGEKNHLPYDVVVQTLKTKRSEQEQPQPPLPENFHITDDDLGSGGPKEKFWRNTKAIATLKQIEQENRHATPEEQHILSQYVGWGGLPDAFDPKKTAWTAEYSELKNLLTESEYALARGSTLNAHYTSPVVIKAIYDVIENMGFQAGNILEPACGVGNFFGLLPESMAESRLYGVELDSISGRIAKQLYPQASITVAGFETTDQRDFYDLAIGNVPFGNYQVNDRAYNRLGFSIHNYFFAKALDQVRPGGIVAFVTSRYTMDAKDSSVRRYLAQRAELLGAIRLPNNAFRANAGTDVVSDIIFLQKRDRQIDIVPDWTQTGQTEEGFTVNQYFLDHPDMVLGQPTAANTQYGKQDYTVAPFEDTSLSESLAEAVRHIHGTYLEVELENGDTQSQDDVLPADPDVRNYSFACINGEIYYRENSVMKRQTLGAKEKERMQALITLRAANKQLIASMMDFSSTEEEIQAGQETLTKQHDAFVKEYGYLNDRANAKAFEADSSYYLLCALEKFDDDGNYAGKADIFSKRTIRPHEVVTSVDTAVEALTVSIGEKACVDMEYMSQLSGKTPEELENELSGVIYRDIQCPENAEDIPASEADLHRFPFVTADEYLSGNVRRKLRMASAFYAAAPASQKETARKNVEALKLVQPKDLDASQIEVNLGATWIDKSYIQQFMLELLNPPQYARRFLKVQYSPVTAAWSVENARMIPYNDTAAHVTYGTQRMDAYTILENTLNLRDVKVYDKVEIDGKEKRVPNQKETTLALQKQQAIKEAFREWIWKDPERRRTLVQQYNEEMNSTRVRQYDGSSITFAGMNPEITLREHQLGAIAHILYGGNTLLAHEVGAGKTFEMIAAAMESKRLGLCQKSLFVVPNHLTEQWRDEFLRLYPAANILVTTKRDFEPARRKKFCARIATGDYDAIIIGHSQFEKIPVSRERQERILQEQIDEITAGIAEVKSESGESFTVKQLERARKSLESKMEKLQAQERKDNVITFEELGVDRLFVDEAHSYKNLFFFTKMRNVAGLPTSDAQKSSDMFAKCRYMDEITGSKGVVFATGTPVSNSMAEIYTMQRYLQYDRLCQMGLVHFDCWASRFGETVTALEFAPEGSGFRERTRFSRFYNLPELMTLFCEVADIKTADTLNIPKPSVEYTNIVAEATENQKKLVQLLSERAAAVHNGRVNPREDNMLNITTDGRKLGLDQRVINELLPDEEKTKVNFCVQNTFRLWQETKSEKLTQIIFCDTSTPKSKNANKEEKAFTVYEDIREKLVSMGIPKQEIAFIHEADTDAKKKVLFSKVRRGDVRVLMGSTKKMGEGMNVQDRLIANHDLDCPWRPGDLQQRKGRIERQGNHNEKVHIYRYVTNGTFDAYLWQTVEIKQKFISQIMTSKSPVRSCEDVDETALSYAEIKALCAGDPRIKERMELEVAVSQLKIMQADHRSNQYQMEDRLTAGLPKEQAEVQQTISGILADIASRDSHAVFSMRIGKRLYADKGEAGKALTEALKRSCPEPQNIGELGSFRLESRLDSFGVVSVVITGARRYHIEMGVDPRGNITRIENALKNLEGRLEKAQERLAYLENEEKTIQSKLQKPFPREKELEEKQARLNELILETNLSEREQEPPAPQKEGDVCL